MRKYVHKPVIPEKPPLLCQLRRGMWVAARGSVGILHGFKDGQAIVHLVKADGATAYFEREGQFCADCIFPIDKIRQAKQSEIPACRVSHLNPDQLERMGYAKE